MQLRRIPPLSEPERGLLALLRATAEVAGAAPAAPEGPAPTSIPRAPAPLPAAAPGSDGRAPAAAGEPPPGPRLAGNACWRRVLDLCEEHRISERLYARRARGGWWEDCPDWARAELRQCYLQTSLRHEHLYGELARAVAALRGRGITPILLKGAALTLGVIDDLAARPSNDVDLLVAPSELDAAAAALEACGFRVDESHQTQSFYRAHHYHLIFRHPDRPWVCLEVHWDLTLPLLDTRLDAAAIRERALPAVLSGEPVRVLEPGDFLLHLVLHCGINGFAFLGQLCDVADLVARRGTGIDAPTLWRRAQDWKVATPLRAALELLPLCAAPGVGSGLLAAAPRGRLDRRLRALLRPEFVVRQRLRESSAGGLAAAILRRDGPAAHWACVGRRLYPSAVDMAMEGHDLPTMLARKPLGRLLEGVSLVIRAVAFTLLAQAGWELIRRPRGPGSAGDKSAEHPG